MEEFIKLREAELAEELEKAVQELQKHQQAINELQALVYRIQGAQALLSELKKKQTAG